MDEVGNIEDVLTEINRLITATRVLHPEQAILRCITFFDIALKKSNIQDLNIDLINHSLKEMTKINNGNLSPQCSISIATRLVNFFKLQKEIKNPPFDQICTEFLKTLTPASTIAVGELCNSFGYLNVETLCLAILKLKTNSNRYENIYGLIKIFRNYKTIPQINKYAFQIFQIHSKSLFSYPEKCHLISFKLLRVLVKSDILLCQPAVDFAESVLKKNSISQFIKAEATKLAVTSALNTDLSTGFSILQRIRVHSNSVISKFFEKLSPEVIVSENQLIFQYVRKYAPFHIIDISPFMSKTARDNFFGKTMIERKPSISQISILKALQIDNFSAASLAAHLAHSTNLTEQEFAISFFKTLDQETQRIFLQNSIQKLRQKFNLGEFIISRCLCEYLDHNDPCIDDYISYVIQQNNFACPLFWYQVKEATQQQIEAALEIAMTNQAFLLIESLLYYFSKDPKNSIAKTLLHYIANYSKLSHLSDHCILDLIDIIKENNRNNNVFVPFLIQKFINNPPGQQFYASLIQKPMLILNTNNEFNNFITYTAHINNFNNSSSIGGDFGEISGKIYVVPESQLVSQKIAKDFPKLYESVDTKTKDNIVKQLLSNLSKETHALLLQLVKDKKIEINVDSLLNLLTGNDFLRIELTCEIISFLNPPMEKIIKFINGNNNDLKGSSRTIRVSGSSSPVVFLLLSSVFCNSNFNDYYIKVFLSCFDLDIISNNLFALHALSSLLFARSVEIMALDLGTNLLTTLLTLVNDETSLKPLFLLLIREVFVNILPLVSIDLAQNKEMTALVLSIIESIKCCSGEISKVVFYDVSTEALTYAPQFASNYFSFEFASNSSRNVKVASANAISQTLKLSNLKEKYSNNLKDLFLFLQQTGDERISECIKTICLCKQNNLNDIENDNDQFVSIANSVFIRKCVPGLPEIEPSHQVKETALFCVQQITDKRMCFVYLTKALEIGMLNSFNLLADLIDSLKSIENSSSNSNFNSVSNSVYSSNSLLDLYKEQILKVAEFALQYDLKITKSFLDSIIMENTIKDLFSLFLKCNQRSTEFFELTTKLCILSSFYQIEKTEECKKFAQSILPLLKEIVNGFVLRSFSKLNFVYSFYSQLYSSFVWAEKIAGPIIVIPNEVLYSFLNIELMTTDELWRVEAAVNGLAQFSKHFGNEISEELIEDTLEGFIRLNPELKNHLKHKINEYIHHIIMKLQNSNVHSTNNDNNNKSDNVINTNNSFGHTEEIFNKILYLSQFLKLDWTIWAKLAQRFGFENLKKYKKGEFDSDNEKLEAFHNRLKKSIIENSFEVKLRKSEDADQIISYVRENPENGRRIVYQAIISNSEILPQLMNIVLHNFMLNNENDDHEFYLNREKDALLIISFIEKHSNDEEIMKILSKLTLNNLLETNTNKESSILVVRSLSKVSMKILAQAWSDLGQEKQKQIFDFLELIQT
ncbi:hypothetical protein TRFO_01975 [Tritrichomonas foetus]|uniref:Uncharacterized protein n=1 Tax=Tritrichomonas foetus TaxID=1144522 RepID=A0A1J4JF17_9EUKA|nr:hypothetical protein TRFO_01975 [Tritrichomonas foetus]|eukprot:OHS96887.1 hypothetical protein TRFO_01975 [Tritrichomonas foetus]